MRNLGADAGFAGDADDFVEGFKDAGGFVAHVGGVDAAAFGCGSREVDEFVCGGERTGDVDETGAESERAGLHGFIEEGAHAFLLFGGWGATEDAAHGGFAEGVVSGEGSDVDGGVGGVYGVEEGADLGGGEPAVSGDDGGDAHANEVFCIGDGEDVVAADGAFDFIFSVGVHVDEAWGDREIFGVDGICGWCVEGSDGGDFSVFDGDIGAPGGSSGTVDEGAIFDEEIEPDVRSGFGCGGGGFCGRFGCRFGGCRFSDGRAFFGGSSCGEAEWEEGREEGGQEDAGAHGG
ncbi:MAG: hypothetical protein RIS92_870 [Verrucomicrobiota bacterium]